jgi:hypothetical protein
MEEKLKQAKSMNDVIRIAQEHYDLDQPLGIASKIIVINGLKVAIKTINAKPKK